jgi:hypothetical protein
MNTHQMRNRVELNLALTTQPYASELPIGAWVYGEEPPATAEAYEGGSWWPLPEEIMHPAPERTDSDRWLADQVDPDHIDLVNIDTTPVEDARFITKRNVKAWAWASLKIFPDAPELHMVRESIFRDLVYSAEKNLDWMDQRRCEYAGRLVERAKACDGTEISLHEVQQLEEAVESFGEQCNDWEDVLMGFKSAEARYAKIATARRRDDHSLDHLMPPAWKMMERGVRQHHVKRWVLRLRDAIDASEEQRDRLHERISWALCNSARRNVKWCTDGLAKARGNGVRLWRWQLKAWETLEPAFRAAYREIAMRDFAEPSVQDEAAREQHRRMVSSVTKWTAEQYQHYALKLRPGSVKDEEARAAQMREHAHGLQREAMSGYAA